MIFDPNSPIAQSHETRVRARGVRLTPDGAAVQVSTRSDFVAPDISPLSTHQIEMDKGLAGWTDRDNKPEVVNVNGGIMHVTRDLMLDPFTCGTTVIRKSPPAPLVKMNRQGPSTRKRSKYAN